MSVTPPEDAPLPGEEADAQDGFGAGAPPSPPRRWGGRLRQLGVAALVLAVLAASGLVGAEYYTARPAFCGSCHIMDPYYRSWTQDVHGAKLGARCVDCHYAPGEQHTLHAKFKGLSQLTSYFSGRAGASRPRAHVNNASCLTSRCHGDNAFMGKPLLIGEVRIEQRVFGTQETEVKRTPTVTFLHEKHLRVQAKQDETEEQLKQVQQRLHQAAPAELAQQVQAIAVAVGPLVQRELELRARLKEAGGHEELAADAEELLRLEHLRTRLRQLAGLNCTACHSYDASGKHHLMRADHQICFTCHFNNQAFNRDTGACLKCHEPPTRKILVHDEPVSRRGLLERRPGVGSRPEVGAPAPTRDPGAPTSDPGAPTSDPGAPTSGRQSPSGRSDQRSALQPSSSSQPVGPVLMDHRDIVERGIDCASCHLDVIQGQATVTARDCTHCHDQQRYLDGFEARDTETVAEYHRVHVAAQRARCVDCHRPLQHKLIDPTHVGTSLGFLQPVIDDCQHCHPHHHREQAELLMGTGGLGVGRPMPNAMFGSRLNCQACHIKPAVDMKGDALIKASESTCIACHGADYERLFQQWESELATYLQEAETALARVDQRIEELRSRGQELPGGLTEQVEQARRNIQFVKAGNGIHNKNYALELLDLSVRDLDQIMGKLTAP